MAIQLIANSTPQCKIFFVTDKIQKGEVKVAYCPTENKLPDFFMKPLQGSAFRKI